MINDAYNKGRTAALARFKLGNMLQGAAGYNPSLNSQTSTNPPMPTPTTPPTHPAAPLATGARKANVLG